MKRFRIFNLMTVLLATTVMLSGCVKSEYDSNDLEPFRNNREITLLMGDQTEVDTRSIATTPERTISDAFVLVFDGFGNYVIGEEIDVSNQITSNGSQTPKINISIPVVAGNQVIVLINTGVTTGLPSTITLATLNTLFDSKKWNINQAGALSGKGMPMYGKISSWASGTQCEMVRAVAKIEVKLADDIATNDVTGRFTNSNTNLKYGIYNTIRTSVTDDIKGNIIDNGTISVPDGIVFTSSVTADNSMLTQYVLGTTVSGVTADRKTYYMPEYGSSVLARGTAVGVSDWHKDRPCVILHDGVKYYRLDLYKLDALKNKEFIDLRRNTHITLTIKKVQLDGYDTLTEALNSPGSNLSYNVLVTGDDAKNIVANGHYAIATSHNDVTIYGSPGKYDVLKFQYILSDAITELPLDIANSITAVTTKDGVVVDNVSFDKDKFEIDVAHNQVAIQMKAAYPDNERYVTKLIFKLGNITRKLIVAKEPKAVVGTWDDIYLFQGVDDVVNESGAYVGDGIIDVKFRNATFNLNTIENKNSHSVFAVMPLGLIWEGAVDGVVVHSKGSLDASQRAVVEILAQHTVDICVQLIASKNPVYKSGAHSIFVASSLEDAQAHINGGTIVMPVKEFNFRWENRVGFSNQTVQLDDHDFVFSSPQRILTLDFDDGVDGWVNVSDRFSVALNDEYSVGDISAHEALKTRQVVYGVLYGTGDKTKRVKVFVQQNQFAMATGGVRYKDNQFVISNQDDATQLVFLNGLLNGMTYRELFGSDAKTVLARFSETDCVYIPDDDGNVTVVSGLQTGASYNTAMHVFTVPENSFFETLRGSVDRSNDHEGDPCTYVKPLGSWREPTLAEFMFLWNNTSRQTGVAQIDGKGDLAGISFKATGRVIVGARDTLPFDNPQFNNQAFWQSGQIWEHSANSYRRATYYFSGDGNYLLLGPKGYAIATENGIWKRDPVAENADIEPDSSHPSWYNSGTIRGGLYDGTSRGYRAWGTSNGGLFHFAGPKVCVRN